MHHKSQLLQGGCNKENLDSIFFVVAHGNSLHPLTGLPTSLNHEKGDM